MASGVSSLLYLKEVVYPNGVGCFVWSLGLSDVNYCTKSTQFPPYPSPLGEVRGSFLQKSVLISVGEKLHMTSVLQELPRTMRDTDNSYPPGGRGASRRLLVPPGPRTSGFYPRARPSAPLPRVWSAPRSPPAPHDLGAGGPPKGARGRDRLRPQRSELETRDYHLLSESVAGFLPRAGLGGLEKRFSKSIPLFEPSSGRLTTTAACAERGGPGAAQAGCACASRPLCAGALPSPATAP